MKAQDVKKAVRDGYAKIATKGGSCCSSGCCGSSEPSEIGKKIGYSEEELQTAPAGANLGLGCGNPIALASLEEGETVLDLGSGAGFDCFLAANKVGPSGRVIGIDMTPEMVARAKENALKGGYKNVDFRQGEIENLPVDDNSVDVIISNCVINLVPDKKKAFLEAFRVLAPGGRLMVSDIVLQKELPKSVKASVEAYVGCLSGAVMKDDYLDAMRSAGFQGVDIVDETTFPLDCMTGDPTGQTIPEAPEISREDLNRAEKSIISIKVRAVKPGSS